jgi:hypothetical protein
MVSIRKGIFHKSVMITFRKSKQQTVESAFFLAFSLEGPITDKLLL